jgi:RNA polymerase sigma-70 factor (ECF subfamily)
VVSPRDAALAVDEEAFDQLVESYRRELHLHCYRMLASYDEAEDAVQETYLRAWRRRDTFDGSSLVRAWLYKIATNVCLDMRRSNARRVTSLEFFDDVPWLQPYPDRLLDGAAAGDEPHAAAVDRETLELAFLAALQVLPARQRAALIARDVLGWPAADTAELLGTSVAAANSALQRARVTMREHLPASRSEWTAAKPDPDEDELLRRFIDAHERCDVAAAAAIAAEDIRVTMPPDLMHFEGLVHVVPLLERAFGPDRDGDWRLVPTRANRMPAAATYLRRRGDSQFRAFKLDVLNVRDGRIAEITTFGRSRFPSFGLPDRLEVRAAEG